MSRLFLFFVVIFPATAWSADIADRQGAEDLPWFEDDDPDVIVNGELEEGFLQTVGLGADILGFTYIACTGSLITPRIILSAGHCGDGIPLEMVVAAGSAFFGDTPETAIASVRFTDMVIHPDYVAIDATFPGSLPQNDVAILVLEQEAPDDLDPIWFRTQRMKKKDIGAEVLSVGFGITDVSGAGSGVKRSAMLTIDRYDNMFIHSDSATNENNANICSGDSGGPQYAFDEETGLWEQWAVHSWGDSNCVATSGSTRTDVIADWLLEQIEEVHGTRDRCEINDRYDDGVCDTFCDTLDPDCVEIPDPLNDGKATTDGEIDARGGCGCDTNSAPVGGWLIGLVVLLSASSRRLRRGEGL